MKTTKQIVGFAAACIAAVSLADGGNVVSSEKTLEAKGPEAVSAGRCALPTDAERLADARYAEICSAKVSKCAYDANTRMRSGDALAADASITPLKGGGATAANNAEKCESLKMPSINESDISFSKSLDSRTAGDGGSHIAGQGLPLADNMVEMTVSKSPDAFAK